MAGPTRQETATALARVLDQLSISAWLPAGTLAFIGLLYGSLAINQNDLWRAIRTIASINLQSLVLLIGAVVLLTIATHAFEFEAIQLLEGYWGDGYIGRHLATRFCAVHLQRRERLRDLKKELECRCFAYARQAMLEQGVKRWVVDALEADFYDSHSFLSRLKLNRAPKYDWRQYARAADIRRLDGIIDSLNDYPDEDQRVLPTRLGNILRSREEKAYDPASGSMEGMIIRIYDRLPPALQHEHDRYRSSLDLYCSMVIVFFISAVAAVPVLSQGWELPLIGIGVLLCLALLSYRAAIASARGYGTALEEVSQLQIGP